VEDDEEPVPDHLDEGLVVGVYQRLEASDLLVDLDFLLLGNVHLDDVVVVFVVVTEVDGHLLDLLEEDVYLHHAVGGLEASAEELGCKLAMNVLNVDLGVLLDDFLLALLVEGE